MISTAPELSEVINHINQKQFTDQMASAPTYFLCLAIGLMMVIITYIKVIIFVA